MPEKKEHPSIFIIVPTFNEAAVLAGTLTPLYKKGYTIVVVDDGSSDETWSILQDLPVYALRHPINLGQGAALQTGMSFALLNDADVVVHFDADGQHRPNDIETLVEPILKGKADVVLGSRFLRFQDEESVPLSKRIILRVAVIVNGLFTGMWLSDAHNGLRALSKHAVQKIHLRENRYAHASEIVHQIKALKLKYTERATKVSYTKYSTQKGQSFWNAFNIVVDMILRGIFK